MINFDSFIASFTEELRSALQDYGDEIRDEILKTATVFVTKLKSNIETWSEQMKNGELSKEDLEFLIDARKDQMKLAALRQKGLAQVRLDRLQNTIKNSLIGSIRKAL